MPALPIDFVVCGFARPRESLPPEWQDNIEGPCVGCEAKLMWRPESPQAPHLCFNCAAARVIENDEPTAILAGPGALLAIMGEEEGSC